MIVPVERFAPEVIAVSLILKTLLKNYPLIKTLILEQKFDNDNIFIYHKYSFPIEYATMPGAPTTEDYGNYQFICIKKFGKY